MIREYICEECERSFSKPWYPSSRPVRFCGHDCSHANLGRNHKAPWLSEINNTPGRNKRIALESKEAIRAGQPHLGQNNGRTYAKLFRRHEHRVIAESVIKRKLLPTEVVHHKDNNKRNNDPNNLVVMTRAEHTRMHTKERHAARKAA